MHDIEYLALGLRLVIRHAAAGNLAANPAAEIGSQLIAKDL